ncbi:MAG TPA: SDR family NAD(P)-dependent oxidoreductase [Nitrospiria bacterium]
MRLQGRIALITGGSKGIGRSLAQLFSEEGAKLIICSRTEHDIQNVARQLKQGGGEVYAEALDISDGKRLENFIQKGEKEIGPIDILINNASLLGPMVPLLEMPLKDWEKVLSVNLTAIFHLTQLVLPKMLTKGKGCIINMTSSVGRKGRALWGGYSVSKFGVEGITQVLAEELRDQNIRVMALNPGGTRTEMRARAYPNEDPKQLPAPDTIAHVVLHLVLNAGLDWSGRSLDARDFFSI